MVGKCCDIDSMCGRTLWQGVIFVGISTIIISVIALLWALVNVLDATSKDVTFNDSPVLAMNYIFALVCTCISLYEIAISLLLLWQAIWVNGKIYLCCLWYVSQLSILNIYGILFVAKTIICYVNLQQLMAVLTAITGLAHQATFIYFAIIVNSFLHSLDKEQFL